MPESVIEVRGLRKAYGEFEAVKGIDITIAQGEVTPENLKDLDAYVSMLMRLA